MNSKIFVPALIASVLAAVVAIAATADKSPQKQRDEAEKSLAKQTLDIDGSIAAYAREAKARGLQRIVIRSPIVTYDGELAGLDEVLADHSLVIARAIERRSMIIEPNVITTWYKFKISDTLWKKKPARLDCKECTLPEPPPEMLPLKHDEVLIPEAGGTVIFEGVEVTMVNSGFPEFQMAQDYLLVLAQRTPDFANVRSGGLGAFTVNADGTLQTIDKKPSAIGQDLKKRYRNSLHELKKQFKENAAAEK